jgi:UPF0755 protein
MRSSVSVMPFQVVRAVAIIIGAVGRKVSGMANSSRTRALTLAALVLLALAAALLLGLRWWVEERPLPMTGEAVEFRVKPGTGARGVAQAAREAGIDVDSTSFALLARLTGTSQALRAGRYSIERGTTLAGLLAKLRSGDVLRERLTVVEGSTFLDMRAVLAATPELRQDSAAMTPAQLLQAIGATESHPEGLFAPDTYVFDPGSSDLDIWRQAYRAQMAALQDAWDTRAGDLPYRSPYEALIMASIIEKETGQAAERSLIGGVFVNRLRRGMLLQTDPTIIYGLGDRFDGNLRKRDLLADGPYNTYTRAGLPPTPIALPGRAAIAAALQPAATDALYFVARGDGTSQFSATLEAHNRAVDRYQRGGGK